MGWYYAVVMGYIQRLECLMIKLNGNFNVIDPPRTPKAEAGIVGETPTHNLPQISKKEINKMLDKCQSAGAMRILKKIFLKKI